MPIALALRPAIRMIPRFLLRRTIADGLRRNFTGT